MKLSHNWLREYIPHQFSTEKIESWLTEIGLEVEGLEPYESIRGGLKDIVTGQVLTCVKHPNADRLSLTTVDIGNDTILQIVCGAPNVAVGQKVLVAKVGAMIYPSAGEPFEIREAKVRGEKSTGMICAEDELGLGESHAGIIVLPEDTAVGLPATELFDIYSDEIIEIGLTPNRSDANSHFGTARDLWAALHIHEGYEKPLVLPEMLDPDSLPEQGDFLVELRAPELCTRYTGIEISNVTIQESPQWLKNKLRAIGQKPINNVVDITNYVMFELGQPLHAFDADKIPDKKIIIDVAKNATEFIGLDGVTRKLTADDLVIAGGQGVPMCIAGVYGAASFGVSDDTTTIFLESACFQPAAIRRTSLRHNLRTESASHFEKGTDPNMCAGVLMRAAWLIRELAGGTINSGMYDVYPVPVPKAKVQISPERINKLLGADIAPARMKAILDALQMEVVETNETLWNVTVPGYKTDVLREADIAEEIGRIYGLNNIAPGESFHFAVGARQQLNKTGLREQLLRFLADNGYNEVMGLSIIDSRWWEKVSNFDRKKAVIINNTSNIHLDLMRPDALASAMEIVSYNLARQQNSLRMFEFGRTYSSVGDEVQEREFISLFATGKLYKESWQLPSGIENSFFTLKGMVLQALFALGIRDIRGKMVESDSRFSGQYDLTVADMTLAIVVKVDKAICDRADIDQDLYFAQIDWQAVLQYLSTLETVPYREFSRFPLARRDLALVATEETTFDQISNLIFSNVGAPLIDIHLFDEYRHPEHVGTGRKSYAISLTLANREKTWSDSELDHIMSGAINKLKSDLGVEIRK